MAKEADSLKDKLKQLALAAMQHLLLAMLMGSGLLGCALGAMGLEAAALQGVLLLGCMLAGLTVLSAWRIGRIALWCLIPGGIGLWLAFGGVGTLTETIKAVILCCGGYPVATLYAREIMVLFTLVLGIFAWIATRDDTGLMPCAALLTVAAVVIWTTGNEQLTPWLGLCALATLLAGVQSRQGDTSVLRAAPVAAGIVLASILLSLGGGVTCQPLKELADTLRQRIEDYLFFTEPRSVFSLAADGYYPQGQNQLGGAATPSNRYVMTVHTNETVYLRGAVKNEYTGRAWYDTTGGRRYLWISPRWKEERAAAFDMHLPGKETANGSHLLAEAVVRVEMADASASSLFVPQRVRSLATSGDLTPYFNRGSEIFATRDLHPGDSYTVTAPLLDANDSGIASLLALCAQAGDSRYAELVQQYTGLPSHLQPVVYELAASIVAGAETPYAKAMAIRAYLVENYTYSLDVAEQPENYDFVTSFLFNTKEGYCTYFASAMTVLCRMAGLPARYVEGYLAEPGADGVAYVTGRNGHAWTEVYFEGFGWLTIDATPGQDGLGGQQQDESNEANEPEETPEASPDGAPTPTPAPSEDNQPGATPTPEPAAESTDEPTSTPEPTASPEPDEAQDETEDDDRTGGAPWLWWLLLVLLALAACVARILHCMPQRLAARADSEEAAYDVWVQAVYDALRVMGLPMQCGESPLAYMRRLDKTGCMPVRMTILGEQMSMMYYGKVVPEREEMATAQRAWRGLRGQLRTHQRLRLYLIRAFVPLKRRSFAK